MMQKQQLNQQKKKWRLPPRFSKSEPEQGDAFFKRHAQNRERSQNIVLACKTHLAVDRHWLETKNAAQAGPLSGDISIGKLASSSRANLYHRPNLLAKRGCSR